MKADTFAKLVLLDTLIEAEIGHFIDHRPASVGLFREGMVSRVSDLVDEIDALDAVAAARTYDAIVDFLAEFPEGDESGVVEAAVRFRRAVDRIVQRGMDQRELKQASTWAIVLGELLNELAYVYEDARPAANGTGSRAYLRATTILARAREAGDRMLWAAGEERNAGLKNQLDRLTYAVRHQRLEAAEVEKMTESITRVASRYRPSTLTQVGAYVLGQVLRRPHGRRREKKASGEATTPAHPAVEPRPAEA